MPSPYTKEENHSDSLKHQQLLLFPYQLSNIFLMN